MKKEVLISIGISIAAIAAIYFICKPKKEEEKSNFRSKKSKEKKDRTKVCNCTYLAKPSKTCSYDVNCNLCCEGSGNTGQEFVTAGNVNKDEKI